MNSYVLKQQAPEGACFDAESTERLVATAATVTVVVATTAIAGLNTGTIAAEAGNQQNPDDPLTASAVAGTTKDTATVVVAATVVTAAAEQKQDNPNPATASTVVISCASAVVVATAITQIAHINLLPPKVLFMLYSMQGGMSMFPKKIIHKIWIKGLK